MCVCVRVCVCVCACVNVCMYVSMCVDSLGEYEDLMKCKKVIPYSAFAH